MANIVRRVGRIVDKPLLYSGNYGLIRFAAIAPDWAEVRVTEGCNSKCITCDAWKNSRENELTTDELINALRQLKTIGVKIVRFSGGESLLRPDLPELVRESRNLGFHEIQIATNGLLLEQKAEQLVEKGGGLVRFDVSIDGIGETDNMIRGIPDHYSRVLAGVKKVKSVEKKIGRQITINVFTTLLKQNISEVYLLVDMCERLGARWC
ncbi:MAG TPA: radical SAM protein, partial [Candidatus Hodarchaeales archaeon]|nr:radical SAM protein [Candidatus Hodarchaeales archaeon]